MSKGFPDLLVIASAVFAVAVPVAAQTIPETPEQRPTELVPICAPTTGETLETTTPLATVTLYNPVTASTPPLAFYNPSAFPSPSLTFYTPLGQIDPPIRIPTLSSPPPAQTTPSALAAPSRPPMPATQTIPSPGPCPPGSQLERLRAK